MATNKEIAELAARTLSSAMNSFYASSNGEIIVSRMLAEHRTINQSFTGSVVLPFVKEMALRYQKGFYDGRNEAACNLCATMWEALKTAHGFTDEGNVGLAMI